MLTFRQGTPGGVEQAKAYLAHLLERTLSPEQTILAEYYGRRSGVNEELAASMGSIPRPAEGMSVEVAAILRVDPNRPLTKEEFGNILGGLRADGTALPGSQRDVRTYKSKDGEERFRTAWMDLCVSAPKKVSLAWFAAESESERQALLQAHRTASRGMLAYIEKEIGYAAFGHGGDEENGLERGKIGFIGVDHFTARATARVVRADPTTGVVATELYTVPLTVGDPEVHTHYILPNVIATESGRVMSIDTTLFAGRVKEFGAVYQALLEREMRRLGVQTQIDPETLTLDLPAIADSVADHYSKRTKKGQEAAADYAGRIGHNWQAMHGDQQAAMLKAAIKKGRQGSGDDLANVAEWRRQADEIGWNHTTVITQGPPAPELTEAERILCGAEQARPILAAMFDKHAVLTGSQIRMAAAQGLMAAGAMESADDVDRVRRILVRDGVNQDGERTGLYMPLGGDRLRPARTLVTTHLHDHQEKRLIDLLAKAAKQDQGGGLSRAALDFQLKPERLGKLIGAPGPAKLDTDDDGTGGQLGAYYKLGGAGRLAVAIGGAGAGKTSLCAPLVAAWHANGQEVWGTAQAWRQANALNDAGIKGRRIWALDPFLDLVTMNPRLLNKRSVVVLDEFALIGTKQVLQLMELREKIGFKVVMTGDARQCQSIAAGNVMDLLEDALGEAHIPKVLKSIRQKSEAERKLVAMVRAGDVQGVIDIKRDKSEARLIHGTYDDAVQDIARSWAAKVEEFKQQPGFRIGVAAPTNADALAISRSIREIRREKGEVGRDAVTLDATDGKGGEWTLNLAAGDRVRIFARTRGIFRTGNGRGVEAFVGNNGTVLTVLEVRDSPDPAKGGLVVKTANDKTAFVPWGKLTDKFTGRLMLTYGDAVTLNAGQGATKDHYILGMPAGSAGLNLFMLHVGLSRHTVSSELIGSYGAEAEEVLLKRPVNAPRPTREEMEEAVWKNVIANLKREPIKASVLKLLKKAQDGFSQAREVFQGGMIRREARKQGGFAETTLKQQLTNKQTEVGLEKVVDQLELTLKKQGDIIEAAGGDRPELPPPVQPRSQLLDMPRAEHALNRLAPLVADGRMDLDQAVQSVMEARISDLRVNGWMATREEAAAYAVRLKADFPAHFSDLLADRNLDVPRKRELLDDQAIREKLFDKIEAYDLHGKAALWAQAPDPDLRITPRPAPAPKGERRSAPPERRQSPAAQARSPARNERAAPVKTPPTPPLSKDRGRQGPRMRR